MWSKRLVTHLTIATGGADIDDDLDERNTGGRPTKFAETSDSAPSLKHTATTLCVAVRQTATLAANPVDAQMLC